MTVLVTGGHGFVGSHVVDQLVKEGMKVVVTDVNETVPNILRPVKDKYVYRPADITDLNEVIGLAEEYQLDGIIHLAAIKMEKDCRRRPDLAFKVNLEAARNMFETARVKSLRRVINLSSAVVFSHWQDSRIPVKVDDAPSPGGLYSTLKFAGEELARVYRELYQTPIVTVRISRVYGPGVIAPMIAKESNPIPQLVWDVLQQQRIDQESGGDFAADFSYVKDVARGIVLSYMVENTPNRILHIGSGKLIRVMEVVEALQEIYPDIPAFVGPSTEPYSLQAPVRGPLDIQLSREALGFEPQYSLKEGLIDYINWIKGAYAL